MTDEQLLERIAIDSKVMTGKPVIKGTRLTVEYILNLLAHGATPEEIMQEYDSLSHEDIQACILFTVKSLRESKAVGSREIKVEWKGPFHWTGSEKNFFVQPEALSAGVYLWTIYEDSYLIYYVGETGRTFAERIQEHIKEYLSGAYDLYDPEKFASGEKVSIWAGMYYDHSGSKMREFLDRYFELSPKIYSFLQLMRLFVAPLDEEKRFLERLESAIAIGLRSASGIASRFQDEGVRYKLRRDDEEPVRVKMSLPRNIIGLNEEILV